MPRRVLRRKIGALRASLSGTSPAGHSSLRAQPQLPPGASPAAFPAAVTPRVRPLAADLLPPLQSAHPDFFYFLFFFKPASCFFVC